ncbi:MAG: hypothetical protein SGI92_20470 [Bryobacteraceae bacterium]|nr:hypothetical protein [Bryobacteraceae bacterium]
MSDSVGGDMILKIASDTRSNIPPPRDTVIRYMLAQPVNYAPGQRFAYSTFGYILPGRVIELKS